MLLNIVISDGLFFIVLIAIIILIIYLFYEIKYKKQNVIHSLEMELMRKGQAIADQNTALQRVETEITAKGQEAATVWFEKWKANELETHRKVIIEAAYDNAKGLFNEWIIAEEKGLRKDAITRSMGVNFGKITEHLLPFSSHLIEFDPRDIRFIGSPVDLMIFSGATAKKAVIDIYFVEIKTGSGQLSKKQKSIRDAIEGQRIHWKPIIVPEFQWDISDEG